MKTDMPHVTWECYSIDEKNLRDEKFIFDFLIEFPERIGLTIVGRPFIKKFFPSNKKIGDGVTGMVVLSESHLAIHTWPELRYAVIDVFSCKLFDIKNAEDILKEFFGSGIYERDIVYRGQNLIRNRQPELQIIKAKI